MHSFNRSRENKQQRPNNTYHTFYRHQFLCSPYVYLSLYAKTPVLNRHKHTWYVANTRPLVHTRSSATAESTARPSCLVVFLIKFLRRELFIGIRVIVLPDTEDCMIVSSFVWTKHQHVTDGRTDGQVCCSYNTALCIASNAAAL